MCVCVCVCVCDTCFRYQCHVATKYVNSSFRDQINDNLMTKYEMICILEINTMTVTECMKNASE